MIAKKKKWDYRKWGTRAEPIHKSDILALSPPYGCIEAFFRDKNRGKRELPERANGKACVGNAVHTVLANIFSQKFLHPVDDIRAALFSAFEREVAERPIDWYGKTAKSDAEFLDDAEAMVKGAATAFRRVIGAPPETGVHVESGFLFESNDIWFAGSCDLVVEMRDVIHVIDWKTGVQLPSEIALAHGPEAEIYSRAVRYGSWIEPHLVTRLASGESIREAMERTLLNRVAERRFPSDKPVQVWHVHLRDFVPQKRSSTKTISRPEELAYFGAEHPTRVTVKAGEPRGPGFYRVGVLDSSSSHVRFDRMMRAIVSWVRMGHRAAMPSENCARCGHREECLSDGHTSKADERAIAQLRIRDFDFGGIEL